MWVRTKGKYDDSRLVNLTDGIVYKEDVMKNYYICYAHLFKGDADVELGVYDTKEERDQAFARLTKLLNERNGAIFL